MDMASKLFTFTFTYQQGCRQLWVAPKYLPVTPIGITGSQLRFDEAGGWEKEQRVIQPDSYMSAPVRRGAVADARLGLA